MSQDPHLDQDALDRLFTEEIESPAHAPAPPPHAQTCTSCRQQIEDQRRFFAHLRQLQPAQAAQPLEACPQEDTWLLMAASLLPAARVEPLLDHAIQCDACGLRLHEAILDLAPPASPEEAAQLAGLTVSSHSWASQFAARLQLSFVPEQAGGFWRRFLAFEIYAWAVATVGLVAVVLWISLHGVNQTDPTYLIQQAYAERRTIEPRICWGAWSPLRLERGSDLATLRMGRTALLRAESEIATHLQRDPEDIAWLNASGSASMLEDTEDSVEAAVTTLEKANRLDPGNNAVATNLAAAYLLRSQFFNRPEDASLAVELLGKVLAAEPGNAPAAFNYALALEHLQLKQRALEAWNNYLSRFGDNSWAREARQHRDALKAQINARLQRSLEPLLSPAAFSRALAADPASPGIDEHVEQYRDVAVASWLPHLLDPAARASPESRALDDLARLLASRHNDPWLLDLLNDLRLHPSETPSFIAFSRAFATLETSNDTIARSSAERALDGFTRAGIAPGRLQAQLILVHLDQYAHRDRLCRDRAQALLADPALAPYAALRIDASLEAAICAAVSGNDAIDDIRTARTLAEQSRYPAMQLRSRVAELGVHAALGDQHAAWAAASSALATWWDSSTPPLRGYNILVGIYEAQLSSPQWFLSANILSEAAALLGDDPRTGMVASLNIWLSLAQLHTGDTAGATASLNRASSLLARTPPGLDRDYITSEVGLALARVDLARDQPRNAVQRVDRIRPDFLASAHNGLILDFYRVSSVAYLRAGLPDRAAEDLRAAIALDQASLPMIATDAERYHWTRLHEPLYRTLVELESRSDPASAFDLWQDFKGAVLRNAIHLPASPPPALPPGTAVVSYFEMPAGLYVWVRTTSQIHGRFVPISQTTLALAAANLVERCSDPSTPPDAWRPYATSLYSTLIRPVEPWLAGSTHLLVEPDGALKNLPYDLLLDSAGHMLSDHFDISISAGRDYTRAARPWIGVTPDSRALIVGSPDVPGWAPLPDVTTEVRTVAASFRNPQLITGPASADADFAHRLAAAQVFHFSGHAQASTHAVGLIRAGGASAALLHLESLRHGQLVVLSACSTARGATGLFDDADSPVQRLLAARVPAVVASRWSVDSEATAQLMQSFYAALLRGADPADALSAAARAVRSRPLYAHPYYWASFAVYGRG